MDNRLKECVGGVSLQVVTSLTSGIDRCNHWLPSYGHPFRHSQGHLPSSDQHSSWLFCWSHWGTVHTIGTDWAGQWYFQLRWLNPPIAKRNKAVSRWSLNLHENDVGHFERIDTWDQVPQLLRESGPQRKPWTEDMKLPAYLR